jgi:hypothetical protein
MSHVRCELNDELEGGVTRAQKKEKAGSAKENSFLLLITRKGRCLITKGGSSLTYKCFFPPCW